MLIAAGPGLASLTSYSQLLDARSFQAQSQQGTTLDTLTVVLRDRSNTATLVEEDDVVALDETDPNGWPTVNLLANPGLTGTYVSGVAPNWTAPALSGYTPSKNTSLGTLSSATTSQQLAVANIANATTAQWYQQVALPRDENAAPLVALPYYASVYVLAITNAVAITPQFALTFYASDGVTQVGQATTAALPIFGTSVWRRIVVSATPPSGAVFARLSILLTSTSATNSYIVLLDAAQLEYATFGQFTVPLTGAVAGAANPTALTNQNLTGAVGAGVASGWYPDDAGAAGVVYSVISAPALSTSAQQIAVSGASPSSYPNSIAQNVTLPNTLWSYALNVRYQVTAAFSAAARVQFGAVYQDVNGNTIAQASVQSAAGLGLSGGWLALALNVGPAFGMSALAGATQLKVYAGLVDATDASVHGTLVVGALSLAPAAVGALNPDMAPASAAGLYPTPYCDANQPGCYTDQGRSGRYYRHLRTFGGYIKQIDTDLSNGPEPQDKLACVEYGTLLQEAPCTLIVSNQTDVSAISAGCAYAVNLGYLVGLDYTTFVQNVGTIDAQAFTQNTIRDLLDYVANETVAAYYVDYYCRLHYGSALAVSAPFNLSDQPDGVTTFPYINCVGTRDSTQTVTEPVIEGGSQTSAPQTYTASGANATLSAGLTNGTPYTALSVNALALAIPQGSILTINIGGGTTQQVTTSAPANVGATTIAVNSFTANNTYAASTPVAAATTFSIFNGDAVSTVTSVTAAGVAQTVGLTSNDPLGSGSPVITATYAPDQGSVTLQTAIGAAQSISVVYTFDAPVLVRLHQTSSGTTGGAVGRKIFSHTQFSNIHSKTSAINRANAMLRQNSKAIPVVSCAVTTPPTPAGTPLRVGTAVQFTNRTLRYTQQLLQIQQVTTTIGGNGRIYRALQLGFYRPDAIVLLAAAQRDRGTAGSQLSGDTILQDVLSVADGWAVTDSAKAIIGNTGTWNGSSTWNGTSVWG